MLTPKDSAFFQWGYTADECIKQLEQLTHRIQSSHNHHNHLSFINEWVALSLETQAVAYYQQDYKAVAKLIDAIASVILSLDSNHLQDYPLMLHTGLRVILSQVHQMVDSNHILALYRLLPSIPCAKTLDIYIMFQCHFGFTHVLKRWRENFAYHVNENEWLDYNALQLDAGIALMKNPVYVEHAVIAKLEQQLPEYVLSIEDTPLAAEWFPWLTWFISQRYDDGTTNK